MIFRLVGDLTAGDKVRPFDDRLWTATELRLLDNGRSLLVVTHPIDGTQEIECLLTDRVRLG